MGSIMASYFITRELLKHHRKKSRQKADPIQIILYLASIIIIAGLISVFIDQTITEKVFMVFFTIVIPSLWAAWTFLKADAKLTVKQRGERELKMDRYQDY
jgi:hypothetical protein